MAGDGAGDGAGHGAAGQDVSERAVQAEGDALPGQGQPGADHLAADADVSRGIHRSLQLDDATR